MVKKILLSMQEIQKMQVQSLGGEDLWRRAWQPTPVFWPGESPGQRRLAGYSPWGHNESDLTEHPPTHAYNIRFPNQWEWRQRLLVSALSEIRNIPKIKT